MLPWYFEKLYLWQLCSWWRTWYRGVCDGNYDSGTNNYRTNNFFVKWVYDYNDNNNDKISWWAVKNFISNINRPTNFQTVLASIKAAAAKSQIKWPCLKNLGQLPKMVSVLKFMPVLSLGIQHLIKLSMATWRHSFIPVRCYEPNNWNKQYQHGQMAKWAVYTKSSSIVRCRWMR